MRKAYYIINFNMFVTLVVFDLLIGKLAQRVAFKDGASFCYCAHVLRIMQCMGARAWSNLLAQNEEFNNATKRATKLE